MDSGSTTGVTSADKQTLVVFDKCLESLFVRALTSGDHSLLAIHKELTDVRQQFQPHGE
jgi:hypothetical protein